MKNSAIRMGFVLSTLVALPVFGWGDCDHKADRDVTAGLDGVQRVEVEARAGDLRIEGRDDAKQLVASGQACASSQSLLDGIQLVAKRSGDTLRLKVEMPETSGWNKKAWLDLKVQLPADVPVFVEDSSGDMAVRGATLIGVDDGSGDIALTGNFGNLRLDDGSGDIRIDEHRGDIELEDGSGDARLSDVTGSVLVRDDGSGDLSMERVSGSVEVRNDGSGDIFAGQVGGDLVVANAGSGDVRHRDITGRVDIPAED